MTSTAEIAHRVMAYVTGEAPDRDTVDAMLWGAIPKAITNSTRSEDRSASSRNCAFTKGNGT
jgi:hypothetical protein